MVCSSRVGRDGDDTRAHHIGHERPARIDPGTDDPAQHIALGKNADETRAIEHDDGTDAVPVHFRHRVINAEGGRDAVHDSTLALQQGRDRCVHNSERNEP